MTFVPEPGVLAFYAISCLILFATPGPDMSLWLAKTMSAGRRGGFAAMLGTQTGLIVHTLCAAIGLSALIAASATAFAVMKIVGALYLAWLAIQAIRSGSALDVRIEAPSETPAWRIFLSGLMVNITNPKVVLFFVTFLPQFINPQDPHAPGKLLFLGLFFIAVNISLSLLLILGAERVIGWLKRRPRILRGIDYTFAGVFGLFAVKILTAQSR